MWMRARSRVGSTLVEPGDFGYARDVLRALYDQAGQTERMGFTFTEGTVGMSFEPTRLGHLHCTVELAPNMAGPFLRFEMEADQSYLPQWIASFDAVLPLLPRN
jgi:hypothetical protein